MNRTLAIAIGSSLLLAACSSNSTEIKDNRGADFSSDYQAGGQSDAELAKIREKLEKEEAEAKALIDATQTSMSFDKKYHDFGDVKAEVDNKTTFTVTNTGKRPLIIEDVTASCGCTTPEKPEKPIAPGESDVITVVFKSKPGQLNEQKKTVTVTANTDPKVEKLEIRAFVKE